MPHRNGRTTSRDRNTQNTRARSPQSTMRCHQIFDTIDPRLLGEKLHQQNYGDRKACHTMITHLGPRVFKICGHFGNITESCGRSILAGCQRSLSLCIAYTNDEVDELRAMQLDEVVANGEIQDLHGKPRGHWIKQHVDDLTLNHLVRGPATPRLQCRTSRNQMARSHEQTQTDSLRENKNRT